MPNDETKRTSLLLRRPHLDDIPERGLPAGHTARLARPADEEAIAETLRESFGEPWDVELVRQRLTRSEDVVATYVVDHAGRVVATASSRWVPERFPGAGYVHWVGTHPAHARKGLAAVLLVELLRHFREVGRTEAVLETDDHRHPAIRSYLRLGYTPVYEVDGEDHRRRWSAIFQGLFG
jgi:mycothiol synthase